MRKSPLFLALGALALTGALVFQEKTNSEAAPPPVESIDKLAPKVEKVEKETAPAPSSPDLESEQRKLQQEKNRQSSPARFYLMPDGTAVPPLPSKAPKKLKLSVVLFAYAGAQMVPAGFRSRSDAIQLAEAALASASLDMKQALAQGDPGSTKDTGWIRQNVLEKYVEYRLFGLKKGELLPQVIDTPRGIWVVKRTR